MIRQRIRGLMTLLLLLGVGGVFGTYVLLRGASASSIASNNVTGSEPTLAPVSAGIPQVSAPEESVTRRPLSKSSERESRASPKRRTVRRVATRTSKSHTESSLNAANRKPNRGALGAAVSLGLGVTDSNSLEKSLSSELSPGPLPQSSSSPPNPPSSSSPADGATGISTSPTLTVNVTDPNSQNLTVNFYGKALPSVTPRPTFSIVALPDTQYYSAGLENGTLAMFNSQTQWIVNNRVAQNISFVIGLGDIVQHGNNGGNYSEWINANSAVSILDDPTATGLPQGIPYSFGVGNHDQGPGGDGSPDDTAGYNQYFGFSRYSGKSYYGGHYGTDNDNHYELFSAGGMDFIVINMAYDDPQYDGPELTSILAWANSLLQTYSSRRAIVVSHYLINSGFNASWSNQGLATYNALKGNPNLFLMLCGHVDPPEGQRADVYNGNRVYTFLSDYQETGFGGDGRLRILTFSPTNKQIQVQTYSPYINQFETTAAGNFTINYDMQGSGNGYTLLGSNTGVPSGTPTTVQLSNLTPGTQYEWYVTVTNSSGTTVGPLWEFTSAGNSPVTLSSANLTFASQLVGTTSNSQNVLLTNNGSASLNISSIAASGDFAQTNTCGTTVSPGANCMINVTFTPTAAGSRSGLVTITDSATGSPQTISLSGTGYTAGPTAILSATNLNFGNQQIGSTSSAQAVTLSNTGTAALSITGIAASAQYGQTNTCGVSVAVGANCTISVTFTPTAMGAQTGTITITDNASGNPQTVTLSGTGTTFAQVPQVPHVILVLEENNDYADICGPNGTGMPFLCGLKSQGSFSANYYAPTHPSIGNYMDLGWGVVTTNDDTCNPNTCGFPYTADNIVREVQAAGKTWKGYAENLPSACYFGSDVGNYAVHHSPIPYISDVQNNCANRYVAFEDANLGFAHDVAQNTLPNYSFVTPNMCDDAHDCSLSVADQWLQTNILQPLMSGGHLDATTGDTVVIVTFDESGGDNTNGGGLVYWFMMGKGVKQNYQSTGPTASPGFYAHESTLRVMAELLGASISGLGGAASAPDMTEFFGTSNSPTASVSPTSLTFAGQTLGTTSAAMAVTLSNTGSTALTITSIAASGDFAEADNCGTSLAAGGNCTINVTFAPTASGTRTGTLSVTDNASGSPQTVSLTGTGIGPTTTASLSPASLTFASQNVGTTSAAQTVTLTNTGSAALTVTGISASGDFAETDNCGSSVAVGAKCAISVTFTPTASGTRTGTLSVADNTSGSPQSVSLSGTGAGSAPVVSLSPSSLTFASQTVGTTSTAQTVTLTNTGSATLTITGISASGDFAETDNCGSSVAAGANCAINVTFAPTASGTRTGTLSIANNASGSPQSAKLTGTGAGSAPVVSLSPSSLTFASQTVGTTSAAQTVTLSNTGNASLTITGVSASGDFAETNSCGSSVAAGVNCTISVTFTPTASGTRTGTLSITDNASGSPQSVSLTGTGSNSTGDFSLSASPTSGTITAGQSAAFALTVSPSGGFSQTVGLACSGALQAGTCTISPSSVTLNGSNASTTNIMVTTTARGILWPQPGPRWIFPRLPAMGKHTELTKILWLMAILALLGLLTGRRRQVRLTLGFAIVMGVLGAGCTGVVKSTTIVSGTPAGTYTLTLTGASGMGSSTTTHSINLTVTVN
jgi:hypothetical protein